MKQKNQYTRRVPQKYGITDSLEDRNYFHGSNNDGNNDILNQ